MEYNSSRHSHRSHVNYVDQIVPRAQLLAVNGILLVVVRPLMVHTHQPTVYAPSSFCSSLELAALAGFRLSLGCLAMRVHGHCCLGA